MKTSSIKLDLDFILQKIADGIIVHDTTGHVLYANKEALKRTGFKTPSDKIFKQLMIMDEFGKPLKEDELPAAQASRSKKQVYTMIRYKNTKTGTAGWASVRVKPVLNKKGEIKYLINLLRFVTDRYLAQRSLKIEYNTTKIMAQGFDIKNTIHLLLKSLKDDLGCDKATWWEGKTIKKSQWRVNKKTKKTSISFPVKIGNTVFGVCELVTNDRRPLDAHLLTTFSSIGFQIAEFIQRKKAQQQIERQRQGFIALVTHELKGPLTSIKGYAQLLKSKMDDGGKTHIDYLDRINTNVDNLIELVNGLLDIAQVRTGKIKFHRRTFSLDKLIDEIVSNIDPVVTHKLIRTGNVGKSIKGDKERIGIVISNLISNAIKYSPNAKTIKIKSWSEVDKVLVSIQDFGIGIPKEAQENIFQLFYRVGTPDVTKTSGVGLGLYISTTIIKAHGGRIWVKSEHGRGSTFYISLPFNPKAAQIEETFPLI